ncbi:uncharacterized protein K460DRAFT_84958 [Cucurbitaria berberidis CBS 394.84]|uniref:Zn(2)-C6 fungal-type domain-containing protein n=1 Tax=Cucurbitaria berberidis CBS 394.84 TaxID=1168544 RepID=A0A9P4GNU6_9PLEO|nr:uncharacterized protein K460DRAFT_84958 [Cucurbitaria berberidis CBS 394.84]KAF1849092.1 hypothetical protein K460DRAFT_84958 [Cucurbitaria berberidis CBS 394.84]
MAEILGLAASVIQIAGAGAKLSTALYNFTSSAARADQEIRDIAGDVELTSNALESVGEVFETEDAKSIVSKKAIQDANQIIKRCEEVFNEVSQMIEKRTKVGKDGKKSLSIMGKLSWPMREQRVELNRKRLESLKHSLILFLHVLQLAQGQVRGKVEKTAVEEEREKIRELHQRQQDSLKSLQALEYKFCRIALDEKETLPGSNTTSRESTFNMLLKAEPVGLLPFGETTTRTDTDTTMVTDERSISDDTEISDSDATATDYDDEHISTEELANCAKHVHKLLKRITELQQKSESSQKPALHQKKQVHKMYRRFCRQFESQIIGTPILPPPVFEPLKVQSPTMNFADYADASDERKLGELSTYRKSGVATQRRRQGPLTEAHRNRAHRMRCIRACTNCKELKLKCDSNTPCSSCLRLHAQQTYTPYQDCSRGIEITGDAFILPRDNKEPNLSLVGNNEQWLPPDAGQTYGSADDIMFETGNTTQPRNAVANPFAQQRPSVNNLPEGMDARNTGRRKRKVASDALTPESAPRKRRSTHTNIERSITDSVPLMDHFVQERSETEEFGIEEKDDIVDVLLEQWTVLVP